MFAGSSNLVIHGGTYTQIQGDIYGRELDILRQATSPNALHDSGHDEDPPKCLPSTRESIQKRIMNWTETNLQGPDGRKESMMWLRGSAGVGKTAIARSIAERCADISQRTLLATFFFSRSRHDVGNLVATLVYQMIQKIPESVDFVAAVIKRDPLIFRLVLDAQFRALIFEPLQKLVQSGCDKYSAAGVHHVIVLDGLDECQDAKSQVNVLKTLTNWLPQCPIRIHLLVASRPEHHILAFFQSTPFREMTIELDVNKEFSSYSDIQTFFNAHFDEIKSTHQIKKHIPSDWPSLSQMYALADKASGQFIYATTVMKYVASPYHNPVDRLDEILVMGLPAGVAQTTSPLAEVDTLYKGIISRIHHPWAEVRMIITPILFSGHGLSLDELERFFRYKPGDLQLRLTDLSSVISIVEDEYGFTSARPFHASFQDFLTDPARSNDLCITGPIDHTAIVRRAFEILRAREKYLFRLAMRLVNHHLQYIGDNSDVRQDILSFPFPGFRFLHDTDTLEGYFSYLTGITSADGRLRIVDTALSQDRQQHFAGQLNSFLVQYYKNPQLTFLLILALHHRKLFSISRDRPNIAYTVVELDASAKALDQRMLMLCDFMADPFVQPARRYLEILQMCFQPLAGETPNPSMFNYPINSYSTACLTGKRYASATIVACKYVISHVEPFRVQIQQPGETSWKEWEKEKFSHALDVIALALPLADRSTELRQVVKDVRSSLNVQGLDKVFSLYFEKAKAQIYSLIV